MGQFVVGILDAWAGAEGRSSLAALAAQEG